MFDVQQQPQVWYNSPVKMILATIAVCLCGSAVWADTVVVHSNVPPDTFMFIVR